jgi:hypothetical protein
MRTDEWSVEFKFTDKMSFSLKLSELLEAEKIAILDGRESLFGIRMGNRDWWVMSDEVFSTLRATHGDAAADPGP